MKQYTYEEKTTKDGVYKIRCWDEDFIDEDTGDVVTIKRSEPIELNGVPIRFYSTSEMKRMSKEELAAIDLKNIKK